MTTLSIQDLSHTATLDSKALAAVQGGMYKGAPSYWLSYYDDSSKSSVLNAEQFIGQNQKVSNANGNNVAFAGDITSNLDTTQKATNNIFRS